MGTQRGLKERIKVGETKDLRAKRHEESSEAIKDLDWSRLVGVGFAVKLSPWKSDEKVNTERVDQLLPDEVRGGATLRISAPNQLVR